MRMVNVPGSSPLARGLQLHHYGSKCVERIIPARAGFTDYRSPLWCSGQDHPRSRGVYAVKDTAKTLSGGSSPLARGLRCTMRRRWGIRRIIPARAGFTFLPHQGIDLIGDHPRSRGVYGEEICLESVTGGIIPARAGFTWRGRSRGGFESDHPRSRGVYRARARAFMPRLGSSPLARGLRIHLAYANQSRRIIPARAGFTSAGERPACRARDHPRSRGVYKVGKRWETIGYGSSPLARGLLNCVRGDSVICGIIPARAGFTLCGTRIMSSRRDHPRSRGVYLCSPCAP